MNTIKIFFNESGAIAEIVKDFPLYQYSYQNKLLNVYVPTSIIAPNIKTQNDKSIASTAVKIAMMYTKRNGEIETSSSKFCNYVKTLTYNNVEYALYERLLPKEFTLFSGVGANSPILVCNVVNVTTQSNASITASANLGKVNFSITQFETQFTTTGRYEFLYGEKSVTSGSETQNKIGWLYNGNFIDNIGDYGIGFEGTPNVGDSIVIYYKAKGFVLAQYTTQTCSLEVMPSANIEEETYSASEIEIIEATINAINDTLQSKQDKEDGGLTTESKTVVGAINETSTQVNFNKGEIASNSANISDLQNRVGELEKITFTAETPIGRMVGSALPTNEQLDAFVQEKKGRNPKANDSIIFVWKIEGKTDRNFKYIYIDDTTLWDGYEIPPIEEAGNGSLGLIAGTYNVGSDKDIIIDIVDGIINNIYYKNDNGEYINLRTKINIFDALLKEIINGTQQVGKATSADNDSDGNKITTTYAKASNVYTKGESDNRFLPSTYTNIYYYSQNGLVDDVPTTPASGIQFTKTINTIGETTFFECETELKAVYNFNKNSLDSSELWLSASRDCVIGLKLITFVVDKTTSFHTTLSTDLSGDIELKANTPKKVVIDSVYSDLAEKEIKTEIGEYYYKYLTIITKESEALTLDLYSNNIYPSTFRLNAQSKNLGGVMVNGEFAVVEFTSEPQAQIGDLTSLATTEKNSLVGAINEVKNSSGSGETTTLIWSGKASMTISDYIYNVISNDEAKEYKKFILKYMINGSTFSSVCENPYDTWDDSTGLRTYNFNIFAGVPRTYSGFRYMPIGGLFTILFTSDKRMSIDGYLNGLKIKEDDKTIVSYYFRDSLSPEWGTGSTSNGYIKELYGIK